MPEIDQTSHGLYMSKDFNPFPTSEWLILATECAPTMAVNVVGTDVDDSPRFNSMPSSARSWSRLGLFRRWFSF